jgi:hypothetical protein
MGLSAIKEEQTMEKNDNNQPADFELVHSYSRKQALEDGVLIDVTETAREAGFRYPVALTAAVYAQYVEVPEEVSGQDIQGRLWDVLWMLLNAIRRGDDTDRVPFELYVRNSDRRAAELVRLVGHCGPGDELEPVITVMLPGED